MSECIQVLIMNAYGAPTPLELAVFLPQRSPKPCFLKRCLCMDVKREVIQLHSAWGKHISLLSSLTL